MGKKWFKISLSICITALALWLSFRKLDWQALKDAFAQVNFFWVFLGLVNTIFLIYALGWRWRLLLNPQGKIPLSSLFRLNVISQYTNIIMPARLGEIVRAYLTSKHHRIPGGYVMGTIAIEKVLDFFIFIALWISIPAFFAMEREVKEYKMSLFFCILAAFFLIVFVLRPKIFFNWIRFLSRFLPAKIRNGSQNFLGKGLEAFGLLKSVKTLVTLVTLTFVFVGGQVLTNFFLFKAFDLRLSFWAGLLVLLAVQAGNIPPSVPGKIGVFEYAVILALSAFSISKGQALSYGIMLHVVAYLPKILLGFVFIATMKDLGIKEMHSKQNGNAD